MRELGGEEIYKRGEDSTEQENTSCFQSQNTLLASYFCLGPVHAAFPEECTVQIIRETAPALNLLAQQKTVISRKY